MICCYILVLLSLIRLLHDNQVTLGSLLAFADGDGCRVAVFFSGIRLG